MCLGTVIMRVTLSVSNFHLPVPVRGWDPAAPPVVWVPQSGKRSPLRNHPWPSQDPDQPCLYWASLPARAALEQRGAAEPPHRCSADQSPASVERFIRLILISLGSGSSQNRHSTNSADNLPLLLSIKLSVCNLQHGY